MIGFIFRLVSPLILGVTIFISFFYIFLTPQARSELLSDVFSRLPIISHFTTKTHKSGAYGIEAKDASDLKTASYAVDFVAFLKNRDGSEYVALYPYLIEAGISLEKITSLANGDKTEYKLPPSQIFTTDLDEKKGALIVRDAIDKADYDQYIRPVKIAFEQKARDIALESGILKKAGDLAFEFLTNTFGEEKTLFSKSESTESTMHFKSPNLPIDFVVDKQKPLSFSISSSFSIDDMTFTSKSETSSREMINFGYKERFSGNFKEFQRSYFKNASFKYIDPINPKAKSIISDPSNGYKQAYLLIDGEVYWLQADASTKEAGEQKLAPQLLYLAMSATPSQTPRPYEKEYKSFVESYYRAINALGQYNWELLDNEVQKLTTLSQANSQSKELEYKIKLLEALNDQFGKGKKANRVGQDWVDSMLDLDYALVNKQQERFSKKEFRDKAFNLVSDQQIQANLGLYFFNNAKEFGIEANDLKKYIQMGKETGAISREGIVASSPLERGELFIKHFSKYCNSSLWKKETDGDTTYWIHTSVPKKLYDIKEELKDLGFDLRGKFIIVFKGDYRIEGYVAFVMDESRLTVADDFFKPFFRKKLDPEWYGRLSADNSVYHPKGGEYKHVPYLVDALRDINRVFNTNSYNEGEVIQGIRKNLYFGILNYIKRP